MKKSSYSLILNVNSQKILFNTLHGTAELVDNEFEEKWNKNLLDNFQIVEQEYLKKRGHIVNNEEDKLVRKYEERVLSDRKSKFYLMYSYKCNFNCFYCFEKKAVVEQKINYDMLDNIFIAIKKIIEVNGTTDNELVLFGGEPLLLENRELIIKTLDFVRENDYKVSIISNGVNVKEYLQLFIQYKKYISGFSITIDGNKKEHDSRRVYKNGKGSYDKIIYNIKLLKSVDLNVSIRMNIDKTIARNLKDTFTEIYFDLGFKANISLSLVEDSTCTGMCQNVYTFREVAECIDQGGYLQNNDNITINIKPILQIIELLQREKSILPHFKYCRMSELYVFSPDGKVSVCPQSCGHEKFVVGTYYPNVNIQKEKIDELNSFSSLKISRCRECALAPICGGGCYVKKIYNLDNKTDICYYGDIKNTLEFLIDRMLLKNE